MAKKKSWFNLVKKFFILEAWSRPEKKDKRRKWVLFGRFKSKRLASIAGPSLTKDGTLSEAEEEQSKSAMTVAIATAAAAEAAIAAAQAAAEVVRLTGAPQSTNHKEAQVLGDEVQIDSPQSSHQCERKIKEFAAIRIQTAFRGYLARKALKALKGIVRLQAIIRGRAVRRQALTTLKCLQSIVNIQSQVCTTRSQRVEGTWNCDQNKQFQALRDKIIKMDPDSERRWDDSILTKEEIDALFLSKKEAAIKRERIKEYSFNHRKSTESEQNKMNGKWKYWLEKWVDTQVAKSKELEDLDTVLTSTRPIEENKHKQIKLKSNRKHYLIEGLDSPMSVPRRSFNHRKQCSLGDDMYFTGSPVTVPTYMAATESAKAKTRSLSSPKIRPQNLDTCSESYSPYKNKLSLVSSIASEVASVGRINKPYVYQQRSPSLKGLPGPVKSTRTLKDLSFDSECSLPYWDRNSGFR